MMRFLALMACLTASMLVSADRASWAQETKATTTYQVPTTGEIMDVIYLPEFDEWWVKCREGKGISVYSYDKRSKKWGHALFIPRKAVDKTKKTTKPVQPTRSEGSTVSPETEKKQPEKTEEHKTSRDTGSANPSGEHLPGQRKDLNDKKKWWDPFELLKEGKKIISPADHPLP